MTPMIPDPDPAGLPAPAAWLKVLLVLTFVLHLVPMNLAMGGSLLALWTGWRGLAHRRAGREEEARRQLAVTSTLAALLPGATAFAITLGIAPLLFLQVLYGQLFYTSSVLMAWSWLAVIALLMAGYYAAYALSFRRATPGPGTLGAALAATAAFLVVGWLFTNNMTLMLRPGMFQALYAADDRGLHLNAGDPTLWPRYLHMLVAAVAMTGLVVALAGSRRRAADATGGEWMMAWGGRLFAVATLIQLGVGAWFLSRLPAAVRAAFVGGHLPDTLLLWAAVAPAVAAMALARRRPDAAARALAVTLFGMAAVRHRVRSLSLEPDFSPDRLAVRSQSGMLVLFLVTLIVGVAVVVWMSTRFVRRNPPPA